MAEKEITKKTSIRYQKGSVGDAVRAAKELKAKHDLYVYPTASGMQIGDSPPPFGLQHIIIKPDGTHKVISSSASFEAGRQADIEPIAPIKGIKTGPLSICSCELSDSDIETLADAVAIKIKSME